MPKIMSHYLMPRQLSYGFTAEFHPGSMLGFIDSPEKQDIEVRSPFKPPMDGPKKSKSWSWSLTEKTPSAKVPSRINATHVSQEEILNGEDFFSRTVKANSGSQIPFGLEPSNFIRPKDPRTRPLEPRTEQLRGRLTNKSKRPTHEDIDKDQHRALSLSILQGLSGANQLSLGKPHSRRSKKPSWQTLCLSNFQKTVSVLRAFIMAAPIRPEMAHWWLGYIDGTIDPNNPGPAPRNRLTFSYLSPPYIPQGRQMQFLDAEQEEVFGRWVEERAAKLIHSISDFYDKHVKEFGSTTFSGTANKGVETNGVELKVTYGGYSVFDDTCEIIKGAKFPMSKVSRKRSISAHAFMTRDVLVVLDTKKDWRFRNNPLVTRGPRIRFFAAVTLFTRTDEPYGVVWIAAPEPCAWYPTLLHRTLQMMSWEFGDELVAYAKSISSAGRRFTPLLERDSLIYGNEYCQQVKAAPAPLSMSTELCPTPLIFHKQNHTQKQAHNDSLTPPSSSESNQKANFDKFEQREPGVQPRGVNSRALLPTVSLIPLVDEDDIPEAPKSNLRNSRSERLNDDSVDAFFGMPDDDCYEQTELHDPNNLGYMSPSATPYHNEHGAENYNQIPSVSQSVLHMKALPKPTSSNLPQSLAQLLATQAKKCAYDLMYIVELKPSPQKSQKSHEPVEPEITMKIICAYGLDEKFSPNYDHHVKAFRQRFPLLLNCGSADGRHEKYEYGLICKVIAKAGKLEECRDGIVLGAFRLEDHSGVVQKDQDESVLMAFAKSLQPYFPMVQTPSKFENITARVVFTPYGPPPRFNINGNEGTGSSVSTEISSSRSSTIRRDISDPTTSVAYNGTDARVGLPRRSEASNSRSLTTRVGFPRRNQTSTSHSYKTRREDFDPTKE